MKTPELILQLKFIFDYSAKRLGVFSQKSKAIYFRAINWGKMKLASGVRPIFSAILGVAALVTVLTTYWLPPLITAF
jgi:hypothetical protein